ncbi:MAG: amidohydrolase family protein [Planctomycetota bacterium]
MSRSPRKTILTVVVALLAAWIPAHASDEIPGGPQQTPIALQGGTVHTGTGAPIAGGTVVFDAGKITAVGAKVKLPPKCKVIDVKGKHVYPGFLDAYTQLGLVEVAAVRATRDSSETGRITPNVKSWVAVNPDSELIPVARTNGVLMALSAPIGGLVAGQSAVITLDGWTSEDLTLKPHAGLHVNWPGRSSRIGKDGLSSDIRSLHEMFDHAKAHARRAALNDPTIGIDARWSSLAPVLKKEIPIIARADGEFAIRSAVAFAASRDLKVIVLGGYDAPRCADLLKEHKVPVIVRSVYRLPRSSDDDYDAPYTLPERLRKAGIEFCIASADEPSNVRNLPFHAGTAVAYGLPRQDAIHAITLAPAKIFGIDKRVGSLEVGKDATLFVSNGDPLEIRSQVENAYVAGRVVDLSSRHVKLYEKYREKYRQQKATKGKKRR